MSAYQAPPVSLLQSGGRTPSITEEETAETMAAILSSLSDFGIKAEAGGIYPGPAVTRYELTPARGTKLSKIAALSDDIAFAAGAENVQIETSVPGKKCIAIEVPNRNPASVPLRDVLESAEFKKAGSPLAVALGKDISGFPYCADIAKMPHVLIAGSTGSGKSVCINTLILSILFHASPDEVKFILIDPKVVELSVYNGIPHLLMPVVTDMADAASALSWCVSEMNARYGAFAEEGVRNIEGYNEKAEEKMPRIVVIVDEMADLMMTQKKSVETSVVRIAQLARAAGIHLVLATQRPSVNVITGLIKANMPSRIAFKVTSRADSMTILDKSGAEKLIGRGDMLFSLGGKEPVRVQGAFVSDDETAAVVRWLSGNT